jgi:hypothetical protein
LAKWCSAQIRTVYGPLILPDSGEAILRITNPVQ